MITVEVEPKNFVCVVKANEAKLTDITCPHCGKKDFNYCGYNYDCASATDPIYQVKCNCGAVTIFTGKTSLIYSEKAFV